MNTMGKILVFINLLFALVTGGFLAVYFATTTNWKKGLEDRDNELKVAVANNRTLHDSMKVTVEKLKKEEQRAKDLEKQLDRDKREHKQALELAKLDVEKMRDQTVKTADGVVHPLLGSLTATGELERMRSENKALLKVIQEREQKIVDLNTKMNAALDRSHEALQAVEQERQRSESLLMRVQEMEKAKAAAVVAASGGVAAPGAPGAVRSPTQLNPPPAYVHGTVEKIDPEDHSLLQISVGTDAGLDINHTLQVFRLRPRPDYLGTIRIVNASPHKALGRLLPRPGMARADIRPGDEVASSIQPR
jgi:hypothetical protein